MRKLLTLIMALICGAAASQFPEYAQQYRQRLGGAVQELQMIVTGFDADARRAGLTRDEALSRYEKSGDEFLTDRGESISAVLKRYARLSAHYESMESAGPLSRLWVFAKERDAELSKDTLAVYQPAIPVSGIGAAHAAGGFAGGWILFTVLLSPFRRRRRVNA